MDSFEQGTNRRQEHQSLNVEVSVPTPLQSNLASGPGLRTSGAPFGDPDGDGYGNEDEYDDEEELIQDDSPACEKDIVDSRALHNAKIGPIPSTAADFRNWKDSLFLLLGSLDVSGFDYLMSWVSHALKVDTAELCAGSSEKVPSLSSTKNSCSLDHK